MARAKTIKERNADLEKEGCKLHIYGLKLRAMPTPAQQQQINSTFGCVRFTKNFYLSERKDVYTQTGETLSVYDFKKAFNGLKNHPEFLWLKEVDKFALECAIEDVQDAYDRFFKGQNRFPAFKKKHSSIQSYSTKETNGNIKLDAQNQTVQLPKIGKMPVRLSKKHRQMFQSDIWNGKIKGATLSRHSSGAYFVSLKIEEVVPLEPPINLSKVKKKDIIGIDLGLTHFYIDSNGKKVKNPRFLNRRLAKLASLQRKLKNKQKGSANYEKQKQKIAKLHVKISQTRKNFLHQQSRKLVNENQVIVLEDLHVKGMIRNRTLSRSISDASWGMFLTFVTYKAEWANKKVVLVNRFFASSKQCHHCKEKNALLSLSDRTWVCPSCGAQHDRDVNAAKNIKKEGIRLIRQASIS